MITRQMESDLFSLGLSQSEIDKLTPSQAWKELESLPWQKISNIRKVVTRIDEVLIRIKEMPRC